MILYSNKVTVRTDYNGPCFSIKVQVKTTKNTEKLVRRQVVLEDGRVLEDEDPHIIVDTIEDSRTQEVV